MKKNSFEFLIVGAGRGGTSLLAGLLDQHDRLEVGFELYSVAYLMGAELHNTGPNLFDERVTAFKSACEQEAHKFPDAIWGNKITTEQIHALEDHNLAEPQSPANNLDLFFNKYLETKKIVFILRDGRTCVNSKVQRTGQSLETACKNWQYSVSIYKFMNAHHSNNHCIRFEDLLCCPDVELRNICEFFEIPYEEEMLMGTNNPKMLPAYRQKILDLSKTTLITLPDDYLNMIRDDLHYCGYL